MSSRFLDSDDQSDGQISDDHSSSSSPRRKSGEPVYCICRKSDTNRFMIGCDGCEEWFHGDCISITAEYANKIVHFYCLNCREKNPELEIVFKDKKSVRKKPLHDTMNPCESKKKYEADDSDYEPQKKSAKFRSKYYESDEEEFEERKPKVAKKQATKQKSRSGPGRGAAAAATSSAGHRNSKRKAAASSSSNRRNRKSKDQPEEKERLKQCYGPGCIQAAVRGSKYCSDTCGLKLAANRIYEILPDRIRQWQQSPSIADELNRATLEKVHLEQEDARNKLKRLNEEQEELEKLIQRSRQTVPYTSEEEENLESEQNEMESEEIVSLFCVTCGLEVANKVALRHMERCFNRYEAQSSLGSFYKTKIDNLFCDVYNPHQKTYCKRLRVLCPEHSKDAKIGDQEVCGFPLVVNAFQETGSFCRYLKKKCNKHFNWEKIRRALIDMERVQQWLRVDDLYEREQRLRYSIHSRGGLLSLMLHQTISPDDQQQD